MEFQTVSDGRRPGSSVHYNAVGIRGKNNYAGGFDIAYGLGVPVVRRHMQTLVRSDKAHIRINDQQQQELFHTGNFVRFCNQCACKVAVHRILLQGLPV